MVAKRSNAEWLRRYASFVVILFVIAFGTSLSIRANLGSSPISAPPYILSLVPGINLTMGQLTICMHVLFITIQVLLLRKDFEKRQYTQILVSFLFGFYTDLTMWLTGFLQIPFDIDPLIGYPLRFVELLIGGAILAFGIACEVRCDSLMLAGEGFPLAISKTVNRDFGKVKIYTDTFLVCVGTVLMFIYFGRWSWEMVGVGTLVSMFYVGMMVRIISPHIGWLDKIFIPKAERDAATMAAGDEWNGNGAPNPPPPSRNTDYLHYGDDECPRRHQRIPVRGGYVYQKAFLARGTGCAHPSLAETKETRGRNYGFPRRKYRFPPRKV